MILPVGTMLEAAFGKGVSQVFVVEGDDPMSLRPATAFERFRWHWSNHRCKAGEMAAACDAISAIEQAMGKTKA